MGNAENETGEETYSPGEQYFNKTFDINPSTNTQRDKVDLFFSLYNVVKPNLYYSFSVTIINNIKLNIHSYLGDLENRSGKNIHFGNSFSIDYFFQREQYLIIEPKINNTYTGKKQNFKLSNLIGSKEKKITLNFEGIGLLIVTSKVKNLQKNPSQNKICSFQFTFYLNNKIFNNNNLSDLFFIIYHKDKEVKRPLYKSQELSTNNNLIRSNIITLSYNLLCPNNDTNTPIYLGFFFPYIQPKRPIGEAIFYLNSLEYNLKIDQLTKVDLNSNDYGHLGTIQINFDEKIKASFMDYLDKGMQINLDIAIDYTASNNENPKPLHNINGKNLNDYEKAIFSCGKIIASYDYDQLFPVYGFGGIPKGPGYPNNIVSHCFNINFKNDPNIKGIKNILTTYRQSLGRVTLAAPTYFSPVIDKVIGEIKYDLKYKQKENHYYILLILTDGVVNDIAQTKDKIVEASYLPLSIIIVGIGNADFSIMDMFDGDKYPLVNSRGELRKRDIVQFVQFENFKINGAIDNGEDLTEEVLKEIPTQVEEYYEKCGKFY